ncbi:MAG TPA: hypothetical protein VGN26_22620, partial [Armatimonadota bacterium]
MRLDPDAAAAFPDDRDVNAALRRIVGGRSTRHSAAPMPHPRSKEVERFVLCPACSASRDGVVGLGPG